MKTENTKANTSKNFFWMAGILIVIVLAIITLAILSKNMSNQGQAMTYEDCANQNGSRLQETYPEVCVTKSGHRFVNPAQLQGCRKADFATNPQVCK